MKQSSIYVSLLGFVVFLIATLSFLNFGIAPSFEYANDIEQTRRGIFFSIAKTKKTIVAAGEHGRIFYSKNEGQTWTSAKTSIDQSLTSLFFLNDHLGWVAGYNGVILKTTDSGVTWSIVKQPFSDSPPLFSIWFKDELTGFAVGADSSIYRTVDGGNNWTKDVLDVQTHLYSIVQTSDGVLWVAGDNQALYSSDDLGITWTKIEVPFATSFFTTIPASDSQLIIAGLRGRVSLWKNAALITSSIESDENILWGERIQNGKIVLAGQRGLVVIGDIDSWVFRSLRITPQLDIVSFIELTDVLIFVGDFGILRVPKLQLGL